MAKKYELSDFLAAAEKKHHGTYDYSKVEYLNSQRKVCIICPIHGEFWQLPSSHLIGKGCPKCGRTKIVNSLKLNETAFIIKANKVHNGKYDYSKLVYGKNNKENVCIICHEIDENGIEHGEFWQMATNHLMGAGCPKCKAHKIKLERKKKWEDILGEMTNKYGGFYFYDEATYVNTHTKMRMICPNHGEFWVTPNSHMNGQKCIKCNGISVTNFTEFVEASNIVHKGKYKYTKYEKTDKKVPIICPIHGEFWQTPHSHLRGCGCPKCNESHLEKETRISLENKKIEFNVNHHFKWLSKLHLDFFIPKYNVAIECQGEQHFHKDDFFERHDSFENRIKRDVSKKQLCEEHGIKLYYFSHEKFDEFLGEKVYHNIDELLDEIFGNNE